VTATRPEVLLRVLESHRRRGLRKVTLHALMTLVTMQTAAAVRAQAAEAERVLGVSRKVAWTRRHQGYDWHTED
jgi:acetolactate synthase regulatory subunit